MKKVVIIGGGFAGINLANGLARRKDFHVTVVDRNNYNFFPPLLYQIATGYLEPSNISYPFRRLWRKKENISFHMAEFQRVISEENKVVLSYRRNELWLSCICYRNKDQLFWTRKCSKKCVTHEN